MCGILGVSSTHPINMQNFKKALDSLKNRGPDAEGIKLLQSGEVVLGHRRLAIIDLSADSNQPMHNQDQSLWLIFNGEIYNFIELRAELEAESRVFLTQSDSEVILHAYEHWGEKCLDRFRGIFAFAIYDSRNETFFLARDHFGTKPLYYFQSSGCFAFASQPSTINLALQRTPEIDEYWLHAYLIFGNVPAEGCIYSGIRKLQPGCFLRYNGQTCEVVRYRKPRAKELVTVESHGHEHIKALICDALRINQRSDVPVAYFLSGGIDSSILCSIAQQNSSTPIHTFSVGFDEPESDESEFALEASSLFGTKHLVSQLGLRQAISMIPTVIDSFDEPFNINGLLPYAFLSKIANAHGFKVAIGGDGADEIFGGYLWHEKWWKARRLARFQKNDLQALLKSWFHSNEQDCDEIKYLDFYLESSGGLSRISLKKGGLYHLKERFVHTSLDWAQRHSSPESDLFALAVDQECFLPDHCLTKVDRISMHYGLEVRVPYLDQVLTDAVSRLSSDSLLANGVRKHLLKDLFAPNLESLNIDRKKGFSSPLDSWWERGFRNCTEHVFENSNLASENKLVGALIEQCRAQNDVHSLFSLFSLCLWEDRWISSHKFKDLSEIATV